VGYFIPEPPSAGDRAALTSLAATAVAESPAGWQRRTYRGMRQNALRVLVAAGPGMQTS
jgi:hypothetical protein